MADYSYGGQGPSYTDILRFARERLGLTPRDMAAAPAQYGAQPQETSLFAPPTTGALSAAQAAPYAGGAAFGGADTGQMMTIMPVTRGTDQEKMMTIMPPVRPTTGMPSAPIPPGPVSPPMMTIMPVTRGMDGAPAMMTTMPVTRGIDGGSLLVDESGRSAPIPPGPATFPPPTMTTMPVQGGMSGALSAARPETAGGLARAMGAGAPATAADAMSSVLGGTSKPNVGAVLDAYLEAQKRGDRHAGSILARSGLSDAEIAKALNAATGRNLTEEQVRTSLDIYQPGGVYEKAKLGMPNVVIPPTPAPKVESSLEASLRLNREAEAAREAFRKQYGWYEDSPEQQFVNKYGFTPSQVFAMTPDQRLVLASKYGGATFSNDLSQFAFSYAPKP